MSDAQFSLFDAVAPVVAPSPPPRAPLPDDGARLRIQTDLATNLLVEAGAGAGKTTEMVRRMVALVRAGIAQSHQLAAVTFTRKAAAELRERFQTALEKELRNAVESGDTETAERLDTALRGIDRAFLGTIHAFCARLLRERPLDAGLDPAFRETLGTEETRLRREFWHLQIERMAADGDPGLAQLRDVGLAPQQLLSLYEGLTGQPDVEYPAESVQRPNAGFLRRRIEDIMDRAISLLPADEPHGGWDRLQVTLRMLRFHRFVLQWTRDARFLDILAELRPGSFKVTKNRWPNGDAARRIEDEFVELFVEGGAVNELLREWWAYRYPIALLFARRAAESYERERIRAGTLNFQDLLMFAARLLRDSPSARRELSDRYRFLLVDEFQDTDPIQAEVLFLLASDEELDLFAPLTAQSAQSGTTSTQSTTTTATSTAITGLTTTTTAFSSWRHLTPRPGALFVVGDPKQSIYRFRRADMMLYQQVKRRFESFGAVVELTSNFRSRKSVEVFVNDIFAQRFPAESTDVQARYAPMLTQPRRSGSSEREGVFLYELDDPINSKVPQLAKQDSERIATYIADSIASGERRPGDFLLLTPNTKWLAKYAAALEGRNVPVQVTGAGVGGADSIELEEVRILLRALADPGDPTLTLAVLVGLFYGIDYEQLTQHVEKWAPQNKPRKRIPFAFAAEPESGSAGEESNVGWQDAGTDVERALHQLHTFWQLTRTQPADVAIADIVHQLGVLPFAAAGELGETRAGAVLFALDAVRAAALAGDASLAGALATLDAALDEDESEAPLEPGRPDVVRVLNLHKAKGLEAPVVILAMPFGDWSPEPTSRVVRDDTGRALGYVTVTEPKGIGPPLTLARPLDWDTHAEIEREFSRAEDERLLYVAATRAAQELIVGYAANRHSPSPWRSFYDWLRRHATMLELPESRRVDRDELVTTAAAMDTLIEAAAVERVERGRPTYRVAPVTARKAEVAGVVDLTPVEPADDTVIPRGTEWGTSVHDALEVAARGFAGDALRDACRNILIGYDRPMDADGQPLELDELVGIVEAVRASPLWERAQRASSMLVEVPFALRFAASEYAVLTGGNVAGAPANEIIDGRIDLVFREEAGWVIVDYKSDAAGDRIPVELMSRYRGQLALYRAAWGRLTGEEVTETRLLFTATGAVV